MPMYDFKCEQCGTKNESIVSAGTKTIRCQCGGIAHKQLSKPAGFDLRGDGWYAPSRYASEQSKD